MPNDFKKAHWQKKRRSSNFLKHADQDAENLLDEAAINNEEMIFEAISFSLHLNMKPTYVKRFFCCAMIAFGKQKGNDKKPFGLEFMMAGMSTDQIMALGRSKLCGASFKYDDALLEEANEVVKANMENLEGKDIQFFDLD